MTAPGWGRDTTQRGQRTGRCRPGHGASGRPASGIGVCGRAGTASSRRPHSIWTPPCRLHPCTVIRLRARPSRRRSTVGSRQPAQTRESKPSPVGTSVISPQVRRPGSPTVKSRRTRSECDGAVTSGIVVGTFCLRPSCATMPFSDMRPSTRVWLAHTPRRHSSAVIRGAGRCHRGSHAHRTSRAPTAPPPTRSRCVRRRPWRTSRRSLMGRRRRLGRSLGPGTLLPSGRRSSDGASPVALLHPEVPCLFHQV